MNKPAAIAGSLVDAKNVNTHKCVRLSIDVPAELAAQVFAAFGWPTMADPVPVAIARLNSIAGSSNGRTSDFDSENAGSSPAPATKERRKWDELPPSQQAAIRCGEPAFQQYVIHLTGAREMDAERAAQFVRDNCNVTSRSQLNDTPEGRVRWATLERAFQEWKREPAFS
jgi:hypothetical protein